MVDFTVSYQPTPDEVAQAFEQGLKRQLKAALLIVLPIVGALGLVVLLLGHPAVGIGLIGVAILFRFILSWSARRTGRRMLSYLCVPTMIRVTDDGYEAKTDQSLNTTQWSLFSQIVHTAEFWLFFVNKQFTGFLPRRAFSSEQQAELDAFFTARLRAEAGGG